MLLLLKETWKTDKFQEKSYYVKNSDALLVYKKSCGSMSKYASSFPTAFIQVHNQLWSRFEMYYYFPFNIQAVIIPVYCFGMVSLMARDFTYLQQTAHSVKIISGFLHFLPGFQVNRS